MKDALDELVEQSVLTPEQAAAVAEALAPQRARLALSPTAEVAAYIGGVLALVAAVMVAADLWSHLDDLAQIAVFGTAGVVLWAGGRSLLPTHDAAVGRLAGTLWLLSTAATGAAAWSASGSALLFGDRKEPVLVLGLVMTVHAALLWWLRRAALQQIAVYAGVMTTVGAALWLLPQPPDEVYGLTAWGVGVVWTVLVLAGVMAPRRTGCALGGVTAFAGAEALWSTNQDVGLVVALATVAALFVAGAMAREAVLVGIGSATLAAVVPQALSAWFPGSVDQPVALFLAATMLLGGALSTVRTARRSPG